MEAASGTDSARRRPPIEDLICPACGSPLDPSGAAFACPGCGRRFEFVAGIADLRARYEGAPQSREEDRKQALALAGRAQELDLAGLLRENWRLSGRSPQLIERFVAQDLAAADRAGAYLDALEEERGAALGPADRVLEVGCGTAALAAAAGRRGAHVVAGDISLHWLVLARKRLEEEAVDGVELVCFAAEEPPFGAASFDAVLAGDVIEHVASPDAFLASCARVLRPGGVLFLATPNRFSLGLEPHVRLWGVGYLPRRLAKAYVSRARHASYDHARLLSSASLRRALRRQGLEARIVPPEIEASVEATYSGVEALLVRGYNRTRRLRAARALLLLVGPFFHVFARKAALR